MFDLSHERIRAYLQLGFTNLTVTERLEVEEHLQQCADCHAYAGDLADLQVSLAHAFHERWDTTPIPRFAPRVLPRVQKSQWPQQTFSYALGLAALVALILLLRAFFTIQLQPTVTQSPVVTQTALAENTVTPAPRVTVITGTPNNVRPTPTLLRDSDFYRTRRLANIAAGAFLPAVSPDGQRVAYVSEREGNWDIYATDLNGTGETRLTQDALADEAPAWSPDGTRIAYQHRVPATDGLERVDYVVMNADGSNKTTVFSGALWQKVAAPQWSSAGDRLAFTNGSDLVVVSLDSQSNNVTIPAALQHTYNWPAWAGDQFLVYVDNGQIMVNDLKGDSQLVLALPDGVQRIVTAAPYIAYLQHSNSTVQVGRTGLDEIPARTLATFTANSIEQMALSPSGQFVAIQTDRGIVVAAADLPPVWQQAPLFQFSNPVTSGDLSGVAWLPDNSGFVYVGMNEGNPGLYLAQLNTSALEYLKQFPTPAPTDTSDLGPLSSSFSPDPALTLDAATHFSFGAALTTTSQINVIVQIVAFAARPREALADCTARELPTDRPFWTNQATFAAGQVSYGQDFIYTNDVPGADRLVVRINLIEPGVNGRLLYCVQQVYTLLPTPWLPTPRPTSTLYSSQASETPTRRSPSNPAKPPSETPTGVPSRIPATVTPWLPSYTPTAMLAPPTMTPSQVPSVTPVEATDTPIPTDTPTAAAPTRTLPPPPTPTPLVPASFTPTAAAPTPTLGPTRTPLPSFTPTTCGGDGC